MLLTIINKVKIEYDFMKMKVDDFLLRIQLRLEIVPTVTNTIANVFT